VGEKPFRSRRRQIGWQIDWLLQRTAGAARAAIAVAPTIIRSRRVTLKESELRTDESLRSFELRESFNGCGVICHGRRKNSG
jgi:hypothetical protein